MDWDFRRRNNRPEFEPRRDETDDEVRRRAALGPVGILLVIAMVVLAMALELPNRFGFVVYVVAGIAGVMLWGLAHLVLMVLGLPLPGERKDD
jgi:hypothetical protein